MNKVIYKYLELIILIVFLLAVFLIKLPPLYFLSIPSKLYTTHVIAKLIIIGAPLYLLTNNKIRKNIQNNKVIKFPLFYLLTQSVSIIVASDVFLFLKDYQNLLASFLLFIIAFVFAQKKDYANFINKFIILVGVIIIIIDLIFYLFSNQFIFITKNFIQIEAFSLYVFNLQRGRYNLYLNTELFLPFFINFLLLSKQDLLKKMMGTIAIILTIFLAFVSNFRHRIIFLIFVIFFYGFFLLVKRKAKNLKAVVAFLSISLLGLLFSLLIVRNYYQWDIVDRLLLQDQTEDVQTINLRINNYKQSIELLLTSPFIGVGLGNYKIYVENRAKHLVINKLQNDVYTASIQDPHSIISKTAGETGIIGLFGLIIMILFFLRRDLYFLKKGITPNIFAYVISFWGLFILSLITPSITIFRGGWMWFIRGILEGHYIQNNK